MTNHNMHIDRLVGQSALTQISKLCVGDPGITAALAVTLLKEAAATAPAEDSIFALGRRVNAAIGRLTAPEAHVEAVRELRNTNDALGIIPLLGLPEHSRVVTWIAREAAVQRRI